jgi:rhodanese-related sulfurtransferase
MQTDLKRNLVRGVAALVLAGSLGVGAAACGSDEPTSSNGSQAATSQGGAPQAGAMVDVAAFSTALEQPGTTIVDVRTPEEFAAGHLAGAVNVDVEGPGFADAVAGLDPAGTYAVYCRSGNRSGVAVSYLVDHGFESVFHLAGGITAWESAGKPVTTS